MFGQPGYIKEIMTYGIPVIEDIAQAYGATIDGQPAGHFGTISVLSFYATKVIGAGEGGAILTDSAQLNETMHDLREYDEKDDLRPRFNAKMTDLNAAIAIEQIKKYSDFASQRAEIIQHYRKVSGIEFLLPLIDSSLKSNNYRCITSHPNKAANDCIALAEKMGVRFRHPVYRPLHMYTNSESLPQTEKAWKEHFSIPVFPAMTAEECGQVAETLKRVFEK